MFDRIWPIMRKEFIQIVRDPRTLAMVLVMPVMQIVLMGYGVSSDVKHIPTYVVDQAHDASSRQLVEAFAVTEYFDVAGYVDSALALRQAIDRGDAKVGFLIPPTYDEDVKAGRPAQVQVIIDGSDPNVSQTALLVAGAVAQSKAADLLSSNMNRRGLLSSTNPPIDLRPDILYNPDMRSVNFMIPGLIGLILMFQATTLTAFAIVREREKGTLEQLIVTPIKAWELMLGKILPYVLIAFWNVGVASAAGLLWFQVRFAGSFVLMMALSVLFLIGSLGLGMLISTVSRTQTQAMQMAIFIIMPSFIISGMFFPLENMPNFLQWAAHLIPLTYFLRILRGIALKGIGVEYLWGDLIPLAIFGLVVFTISASRFQKRLS